MSNEPACIGSGTQVEPGSVIAKIRNVNSNLVNIKLSLDSVVSRIAGINSGGGKSDEEMKQTTGSIELANDLLRTSDELVREISTHVTHLEEAADALDTQTASGIGR